ncbi:11258_t:CDS:2 [Ambispora gerdemannii]|uniref:11258_t:CDS:1 n=1 Tax=Ambispora gerdemannii TaxID=144530 RepID=A0A9N9DNL2_9GLOM|nr:11258_t:CDS:2 [Ambispora gerdemannii]
MYIVKAVALFFALFVVQNANIAAQDIVVTIPSTLNWKKCSESSNVTNVGYQVDLLDGKQKNTTGIGAIVTGFGYLITDKYPNAPNGFLTVLALENVTKNYLDPNYNGDLDAVQDASCIEYSKPVSKCAHSERVSPPGVYCLVVTNPQNKSLQVGIGLEFDGVTSKTSGASQTGASTSTSSSANNAFTANFLPVVFGFFVSLYFGTFVF